MKRYEYKLLPKLGYKPGLIDRFNEFGQSGFLYLAETAQFYVFVKELSA